MTGQTDRQPDRQTDRETDRNQIWETGLIKPTFVKFETNRYDQNIFPYLGKSLTKTIWQKVS